MAMRVTRRDQYSSYNAPQRINNELIYRDFTSQQGQQQAFHKQSKKEKPQNAKKKQQEKQQLHARLLQPMQRGMGIKIAIKQDRRSSIAKYKNSI